MSEDGGHPINLQADPQLTNILLQYTTDTIIDY
jgi:hypothetical protein